MADTIGDMIDKLKDESGVYNLGSTEETSKALFAYKLAKRMSLTPRNVVRRNSFYKVKRPKVLSVDISKVEKEIDMPTLDEVYKACIKECSCI